MLTIVIPVYNRAALITRLLDSIYRQTVSNFSVIIVDNNSTDGSFDTVSQWIESHKDSGTNFTLLQEKMPGAAAARNCGLNAVTTPLTCFYDSDDTLRPEFVESILSCYNAAGNPDIIIYPRVMHFIDGREKIILPVGKPKHHKCKGNNNGVGTDTNCNHLITNFGWVQKRHILNCLLPTASYVAHTELFRKVGGWNGLLRYWDDWEFGIRLLQLPELKISATGTIPLADIYQQEVSLSGINYHSRAALIENTLQAASTDVQGQHYHALLIDLVRARIAGRIHSEGKPDIARQLMTDINQKPRLQRIILRGVYHHTRLMHRGAAIWAAPLLRLL